MKKFLFVVLNLLISETAYSCSICFYGDPEDPMNKGLEKGILVLLGVLAGVLALLVTFFVNFAKRAKKVG